MTPETLNLLADPRARAELLSRVSDEVNEIESVIRDASSSRSETVDRVIQHTLTAGGKRLRPAFVSLSAKTIREDVDIDRLRKLGACMEMIHMATLIHDDVIDNAATRRGRPTASVEFGNTASILSGDVLLARAMSILADDEDIPVIRVVANAVAEMAEGEVEELEVRGDFDLDTEAHFGILQKKTAGFIRSCCQIGAMAAGGTKEQVEALAEYGNHIGLAFQVVDDLLDYRGDKAKTGKPIATDFREGQATLPLIYLREKLSPAESQIARRRFGGTVNDDEIRMICDWMETRGAFDQSMNRAIYHAEAAKESLRTLPVTLARDMLEAVGDYVLSRQH